ncbi:MAG: signal peptide peptidase SppA [Candidatus Brocadiia bacterium]
MRFDEPSERQTEAPEPTRQVRPRSTSSGNEKQKGGRSLWLGCLLGLVGGFALLVLLGGALFVMLFAVGIAGASAGGAAAGGMQLQEFTVSGTPGDPKVVIVPVRGLLAPAARVSEDPLSLLKAMLERADSDAKVRGVVLSLDSGGGGITTCDVMYRTVVRYRDETGQPVVALMENVAASGAYYLACAADHVTAHPTTITGSIGVLMPLFDAGQLMTKVGVRNRTVKSGPLKDMGSPLAQQSEEQWERELVLLEDIVQQMHEHFIGIVADGRGMEAEAVRRLADGRIFTGKTALEEGLVDSIGYREDAVAQVKNMAGLGKAHVVLYRPAPTLRDVLFGQGEARDVTVRLDDGLPAQLRGLPTYLWRPASR